MSSTRSPPTLGSAGPAIVVDFGTATNFDVVSAKGEFIGGVIAPGMQASAASLFSRTARLTRVEFTAPPNVVGKSTVEAVQSGLIFGTAGEVDAIVSRILLELPGATTIATGGLASVVLPHCTTIQHHEPWLTLEGLRLVFERNATDTETVSAAHLGARGGLCFASQRTQGGDAHG